MKCRLCFEVVHIFTLKMHVQLPVWLHPQRVARAGLAGSRRRAGLARGGAVEGGGRGGAGPPPGPRAAGDPGRGEDLVQGV